MIRYTTSLQGITSAKLDGFFVDWPNPPSQEKHLELLSNSTYIVLALDGETGNVVGFINAISDHTLSAYIPLLEVLPDYKGLGIGSELVKAMLEQLQEYYMVDICCDENLVPFYKRFGMFETRGMVLRNFAKQAGK